MFWQFEIAQICGNRITCVSHLTSLGYKLYPFIAQVPTYSLAVNAKSPS
jgi:hypothetical protein